MNLDLFFERESEEDEEKEYRTLLCGRQINSYVDEETGETQEWVGVALNRAYIFEEKKYLM